MKVKELGVGYQQLVEIAKALSKNVKLLILDEPTASLNEDDSQNLLKLIKELKEQGVTCIMISHKLKEILAIADTTQFYEMVQQSAPWMQLLNILQKQ